MKRRIESSEGGQAMVEFALVIIIVVLVMVGILDFGRVVFAYNDTSHASRDAARQASVAPTDCESIYSVVQRQTQGQAAVSASVDYRRQPSSSISNPAWTVGICPAYDPSASYDDDPATGTPSTAVSAVIGGEIRVVVTNDVALATPLMASLVGGSMTVQGSSSMVVTYVPS